MPTVAIENIGTYRHRIAIQRLAAADDRDVDGVLLAQQSASGEPVEAWVDVTPRAWADVQPLQGREFFAAQRENAEISHLIRTRYDPRFTVKAKDRVVYRARIFDVQSVINVGERNVELQLLAKEAA